MPFVPVPKDLTKVKTKVAFNLTKRQLICFSIAGAIGIPSYLFLKQHISTDLAAIAMVIIMLPLFFVALFEKDGQPFEKLARNYIRSRFIKKRKRIYRTKNYYKLLEQQNQLIKEVTPIVQKPIKQKRQIKRYKK
ncbi:PrgI family protein [Listeria weihenstephanensis]|uniref:PrgI family protein n=1 Tax=Listeria weihenstephanensis TaxID=1006155 RepID=A0A841ZBA5_9LIST|nr:PrgI family protein [Listeria weihenstephanensis]MBC1502129.1 PrgI family protein [Listeria weihenstephanensis]